MSVREDCRSEPGAPWRRYLKGSGTLEFTSSTWRLVMVDTSAQQYTDIQLDDYEGLPRHEFLWRPPLAMTVRARFSHPADQLQGTAGFGFWNDPFLMTGWRRPTLPRAVWFFFASPPSQMILDLDVPGQGWKAATIDAGRWPFLLLLPTAPLAVPLTNIRSLRRLLWPIAQRSMKVREALVDVDVTAWHIYEIAWLKDRSQFRVDGQVVLDGAPSPRGPLGFVLWMDNQYAVVTPWGRLGYGLLAASGPQWLEVGEIAIEAVESAD